MALSRAQGHVTVLDPSPLLGGQGLLLYTFRSGPAHANLFDELPHSQGRKSFSKSRAITTAV